MKYGIYVVGTRKRVTCKDCADAGVAMQYPDSNEHCAGSDQLGDIERELDDIIDKANKGNEWEVRSMK